MNQTCKCMQQITRDYFQTNLAGFALMNQGRGFQIHTWERNTMKFMNLNGFREFIQNLNLSIQRDEHYRSIGLHCKSLKAIRINLDIANAHKIELLKPVLCNIETVVLSYRAYKNDLVEPFLKLCSNLKQLHIKIETMNEWLLIRRYNI